MVESLLNLFTDYWFWAMAGLVVGSAVGVRNAVRSGLSFPYAVIGLTAVVYFAFIGSRLLYLLIFDPQQFLFDPLHAFSFWEGTGTWLGAPIFGAIGGFIALRIGKKPFWTNLGNFAPGAALGHAIARIGCLFAGCCYGTPTAVPWAVYSKHMDAMVHPTAVYSMAGEFAGFLVLQVLWKRAGYRKYLFPLYGILLSTHRFVSEFFRGSEGGPVIIPGLRIFQVVCLCIFAVSLCIIGYLRWKRKGAVMAVLMMAAGFIAAFILKPGSDSMMDSGGSASRGLFVITRPLFVAHLSDWKAKRKKEGYDVIVHAWRRAPSPGEVRNWVLAQSEMSKGNLSHLLIVGDCSPDTANAPAWHIPSVKHTYGAGQRSFEFVSDGLFGDLNGDGCPDVPVGRLPVRNTEQLRLEVQKISDYERQTIPDGGFRTLIWMGAKGYAFRITDLSNALLKRLPDWLDPFIIGGDVDSPVGGHPPEQPGIFLEQMRRPLLFSLVISHGSFRSISPIEYEGEDIFLCVDDLVQLKSKQPSGVMLLLGCDSGKFDMPVSAGPSLAEGFWAHPGGPICVVAASGETSPATNYLMTQSMINQLNIGTDTIGRFVLGIQREIFREGSASFIELSKHDRHLKGLIDAVPAGETFFLKTPELLKNEILAYNLIGDPTIRLKLPEGMVTTLSPNEK